MKNKHILSSVIAISFWILAVPTLIYARPASVPNTDGINIGGADTNTNVPAALVPSTDNGAIGGADIAPIVPVTDNGSIGGADVNTNQTSGGFVPATDNGGIGGADTAVAPTPTPVNGGGTSYGGGGGSGYLRILPSPVAPSGSCALVTSPMKLGANNDPVQVSLLQAFLKNHGELDVEVSGIFDEKTEAAVRAFQKEYMDEIMSPWGATQSSGIVYITTAKKINELNCQKPLTLNASEIAIIDAYKQAHTASSVTPSETNIETPENINNSTGTPVGPEVGEVTGTTTENTAAAVNATILQRFWNFLKNLF